jgi:predicted DNA-binding transcriptional regulator AlpA
VTPDHLRLAVVADPVEPLEPLLTAAEVGRILGVRPKRVYELPIPQIRISEHAIRWSRADLSAWLAQRREAS